MSILVVSVSHKTASMEMLAQVAMDTAGTAKLTDDLIRSEHVDEVVVLSTCNRTEIYSSVSRFHGGLDDVIASFAAFTGIDVEDLRSRCAVYFDEGAVAHTFGVAAGLDSMVVGESQILGQVRAALTHSQQLGTVGTVLNSLFQQGIRVGKRIHTETAIGSSGRSLVTAALDLLTHDHGPLAGRRVVVVGAGSMASLAARCAAAEGAAVTCVNRTLVKAQRLAGAIGGRALPMTQLSSALAEADVVVACTGARDVILTPGLMAGTSAAAVIDLALPADADPRIAELGISVINLERLLDAEYDSATAAEVAAARELLRTEVTDFLGLRRAAQVAPTVIALRSMASEVVAAEMARLDARLPGLGDREREEFHRSVRRVVDKLLHQPTVRVQEFAADPEAVDYAAALRELFALDPQAVAAVMSPEVRA
ncbi:glutamyl-tRNA reductase [Microlunatus panaciterrae]|uniref:Glutamyl-tRNA reductase n=1 Tax=Microlunatus panaciterrae TaxID=400768 RepID=A0ABS2RHA3_9ACTN|nr:glutamyl-tRNA reductase [Microlunatus panaciterrae]